MLSNLSYVKKRINEKSVDVSARPVLIVVFGDSVTQGFTTYKKLEPQAVYHNRLKMMLEQKYPMCTFSVINSGVGGQRASNGLARLERDVIKYDPDLVIVGFALNDAMGGLEGLDEYRNNLEKIVADIQNRTSAYVILLTPNHMATADNENVCEEQKELIERFVKIQNDGILAAYAQVVRDVADETGAGLCDVYSSWTQLAQQGEDTDKLLANGLNHPIAEMHKIPAELIFALF